jgi:hypothetical protein
MQLIRASGDELVICSNEMNKGFWSPPQTAIWSIGWILILVLARGLNCSASSAAPGRDFKLAAAKERKERVKLNLQDLWGLTIAVGLPQSKWVCLCCASGRWPYPCQSSFPPDIPQTVPPKVYLLLK